MKIFTIAFMLILLGYLSSKSYNQPQAQPKYMVKVLDTIYHCSYMKQTSCGFYLECGDTTMHCATNIEYEEIP